MQLYYKYSIIIVLGLLVSSCGITKNYTAPTVNASLSDSLYRYHNDNNDTTTIADVKWQDFFTDTTLVQLIEKGLSNNNNFQNAILQITQAEASFKQSKMAFFPNISFTPQVAHSRASVEALNFPVGTMGNPVSTTFQIGVSANWEVDVWGKLKSAKRSTWANWLRLDAAKRAIQTSLVSNIAQLYFNLMALDEQLNIATSTLELRKKTLQTMEALKQAAIVNGAAVVQSEANIYAAEVTILEIKQSIHEVENTMCSLLAIAPQSIKRSSLDQVRINNSLLTGVPIQLLNRRPDVQEAELAFRSAFENVNVARTQFYPTLSLTSGSFGISALSTNNLFGNSIFYNIIGGIAQPILNKGAIRANYTITKAQQEQALNNFEQSVIIAGQEVSNALYQYNNAIAKQNSRTKQIDALEKAVNYNMQLLQYSSNTNYTDVLTSEQSLLVAKISVVNDQLDQYQAMIELYRALGGGWK